MSLRSALGSRNMLSPHSSIMIYVFGPILTMFIMEPIRKRLAMYTYISWLKSFEQERPKISRWKRLLRYVRLHVGRARLPWRRRRRRGVVQVIVSLLPLQARGGSAAEFPGEIYLE